MFTVHPERLLAWLSHTSGARSGLPMLRILGNPLYLFYATSCMSIRSALQAVASPSEESIDLLGLQGKTRPRMGSGRLRK